MKQDLPDWSLFDYIAYGGEHLGRVVASQKDGAGKIALSILGVGLWTGFAPIALGMFILKNRLQVSTKTWFYLIAMAVIAIVVAIGSLLQ